MSLATQPRARLPGWREAEANSTRGPTGPWVPRTRAHPANALPCGRAESQWKGSNVRRARARLLLDEGADLFGAALTQVPHTGTHQAKIAAA